MKIAYYYSDKDSFWDNIIDNLFDIAYWDTVGNIEDKTFLMIHSQKKGKYFTTH